VYKFFSGYITSLITTGKPPHKTSDGGIYTKPERRMFINNHPLVIDLYSKQKDCGLAYQACALAKSFNKYDKEQQWTLRAYKLALETNFNTILTMISFNTGGYLLEENKYKEALMLLLGYVINGIRFNKGLIINNENNINYTSYNEETIVEIKDEAERKMVYYWAIPSLMNLGTIYLKDSQLAKEYAKEIMKICFEIKNEAKCVTLWEDIAKLFSYTFVEQINFNDFFNEVKIDLKSKVSGIDILKYIGASIVSNSPKESIGVQIASAQAIDNQYKSYPSSFRSNIGDFYKLFWLNAINKHEYRFSGVGWKIISKLKKCDFISDIEAIKKILGIVSFNLEISMSTEMQQWLEI
jgi:hypothetical protein